MTSPTAVRTRFAALAIVVSAATALAGCAPQPDVAASPSPDAADLSRYYAQDLAFGPCDDFVADGVDPALLEINDLFGGRSVEGVWNNQTEAGYAVNCNDEQRRTPEEEAQLRDDIDEASPFMASGEDHAGASRDGCEAWPVEPSLGFPYAQDVAGLPETLVVSITGDPVTPFAGGAALAEALGGSVLEVEGQVHTIAQSGASECVNALVAAYLIEAKIPAGELACTL